MPETMVDIYEAAPPTLDHVVGQQRVVRQLRIALEAHFADRADSSNGQIPALGHSLLVGPPGLGKSLIANIIAKELGGQLHEELAQNITSPSHLQGLLLLAEAGDCVFLDESHELHPMAQTALYRTLEERRLHLASGPDGGRQPIRLPPFTFIAASTDEWQLAKPLRDRFKLVLRLEHYSEDELEQLLAQRVRRLGWNISDTAVHGIAERGRGTPRLALRLLESARRTARAEGASDITVDHFKCMCEVEGIDELGLDPLEQKYLLILKEAQGEPVRLNVIATRLGLHRKTIETIIEADLIRLGLISKNDTGRMLTRCGIEHLAMEGN